MSKKNGPLDRIMSEITKTHGQTKGHAANGGNGTADGGKDLSPRGQGPNKRVDVLNFDTKNAATEKSRKMVNDKSAEADKNTNKTVNTAPRGGASTSAMSSPDLASLQESIAGLTNLIGSFGESMTGLNEEITELRNGQGAIEDHLAEWSDMGHPDESTLQGDTDRPVHSLSDGELEEDEQDDSPPPETEKQWKFGLAKAGSPQTGLWPD